MKIAMIGSGVYSLALTHALQKNNNDIKIWTHNNEFENQFKNKIPNNKILSKVSLVSTDMLEIVDDSEIIFIVTTSSFFKSTIMQLKKYYNNQIICIATKGIDDEDKKFLSDIASEILLTDKISILSGPSFANDLINDDIAALTLASNNDEVLNTVNAVLSSESLVIENINDMIGVQVCNTVKNIVAISSGMLKAMGYTNSSNAFLITKVINDLKGLLKSLNASESTIFSYAGIGDLLLTCTSEKSRNFSFGKLLVDKGISNIDLSVLTVEGYYAIKSFYELFKSENINFELVNILYGIVYENENINNLKKYLK